jgi:hypothetical protein
MVQLISQYWLGLNRPTAGAAAHASPAHLHRLA